MAIASSRRRAEKSAARMGPSPFALRATMTARPTGPQPITNGTAPGAICAISTACRPTAMGSVNAARSAVRLSVTGNNRFSCNSMYSP